MPEPQHDIQQPLWTIQQTAEHLQMPVPTLYRWRQTDYGPPAVRIGKHLRYRPSDVEAFIEAQFAGEDAADVSA